MANQKNPGARPQKPDKSPSEQPMREPMGKPEGDEGGDLERDRSSRKGDDGASVIENGEEVELDVDDLDDDDDESNQVTGRHPAQRDRDLK